MNRLLTIVDSKYQRLEYLESSGTQYIDTGYIFTSEFGEVDMVAQLTQTSSTVSAFCGNIRSAIGRTFLVQQVNSNGIYFQTGVSPLNINSNISDTNKHHIRAVTSDKNYLYIDDTLIGNATKEGTIKNAENFVIFGRKADNSPVSNFAKMKLYSFKLYDNSVLVRNFVPVLRKTDNELGMLDLVEGKFYTNEGTGKFTANLDTMYAIINGSPTQSPYGVFSGFSADNYLSIPNIPTYTQDDRVEFVFNFTLTTLSNSTICGGAGAICVPVIDADGKIQYYGPSALNLTGQKGSNALIVNQNYWFKAIYDTTSFKGYISTDGTNWILDYTKSVSATFSRSGICNICRNTNNANQYLRGTIDIPNSYIKIGSTKYKLQAVVGYKITGTSVVNNNGVLSDFSNGFASTPNLVANNINSIEYQIKIKTSTVSTQQIGGINNYMVVQFWGTKFRLYNSNVDLKSTENAQDNTTYYVRAKCSIADNKMYLMFSTDKINWITYATDIDGNDYKNINNNAQYGRNSYGSFQGEIDMNETWIKINNKLWFNGQQA